MEAAEWCLAGVKDQQREIDGHKAEEHCQKNRSQHEQ
jgi:hypothetical protein